MAGGADAERRSLDDTPQRNASRDNDEEKGAKPVAMAEDRYRVDTLDEEDDPKRYSTLRKWIAVAVICSGSVCATCASSIVREMFPEFPCQVDAWAPSRLLSPKWAWRSHFTYLMRSLSLRCRCSSSALE